MALGFQNSIKRFSRPSENFPIERKFIFYNESGGGLYTDTQLSSRWVYIIYINDIKIKGRIICCGVREI